MRRVLPILLLLTFSIAVAGCGAYGERYEGDDSSSKTAAGEEKQVTDEKFDDAARKEDGCTELKEFESEGNEHLDAGTKVTYEHNPPMSGNHWNDASVPAPADWGLYDETLRDEQTVHNLEHGHIVMTYKGLSEKDRDELYADARINRFHLLVEPREKNPKDGVYYTVWTAQIYCEHPSKAALQYMIDNWRDQGPELYVDDPGEVDAMNDSEKQG
jgi:hypothetical protein